MGRGTFVSLYGWVLHCFSILLTSPAVGYLPTSLSIFGDWPLFPMIHLPDPTRRLSRPNSERLQGRDNAILRTSDSSIQREMLVLHRQKFRPITALG